MKVIFTSILIILSTSLFAQDCYYWYNGEKIPLTEKTNKRFILLEDKEIESFFNSLDHSWQIESKGVDNTVTTLIPYNNLGTSPSYKSTLYTQVFLCRE